MIAVKDMYEFLLVLVNKPKRGSSVLSPKQFNTLIPRAVDDVFKKYYGLPESYQPGRPIPRIAYEQTQFITDALLKQKKPPKEIPIKGGQASYPDDYIHAGSAYYTKKTNVSGGEPVKERVVIEFVTDNEFTNKMSDPISPPTIDYPILTFYGDYMEVAPSTITKMYLSYLAYPKTPLLDYTVNSDDEIEYGTGSVDIDMPKNLFNDIARSVLSYMGLNMGSAEIVNYAEMQKQRGA